MNPSFRFSRIAFVLSALLWLLCTLPGAAHVIQALRDYDGSDPSVLPAHISGTGLYENAAAEAKVLSAGIKGYQVNAPLWSDGAFKQRFVDVPAGAKIAPTDSDQYAIPDKTVFIKTFMIDTVYGDSATRILIETRFLVVRADASVPGGKRYLGMSYMWHRDQKEADLVGPDAGLDTLHLIKLHGKTVGKRWSYPSGSDCRQCHQGRGILGFITPQLNRPDSAKPAENQLKALFDAGVLSIDISKPALFRWTGLKDTGASATNEAKARSYLAANCSHCHGNKVSLEGASHDFDYFSAAKKFRFPDAPGGYVGKPTAKVAGYPQIIYAGFPESSYVMFRLALRGDLSGRSPDQMPPLATYQMDSGAVAALKGWICSLAAKARTCSQPNVQDDASYWEQVATGVFPHVLARRDAPPGARLENGILSAPMAAGPERRIRLFGSDGRERALSPIGDGRWRVGGPWERGVYILLVGRHASALAAMR